MEQSFEEYRKEYLDEVRINAQIDGSMPEDYFFQDTLDRLSAMGELTDPIIKPTRKQCRYNRIMSFDAYAFDVSDKSVVLISCDFADSVKETITKTEIDKIRQRMINFLQEAYDGKLGDYFDITDEMLEIGRGIGERMKIDFVKLEDDDSIDKIKLYILTNKLLSERVRTLECDDFNGKKVELNVWSSQRFYELSLLGKTKEAIVIKTDKYGLKGIPCIKAEMSGNLDYDAYLAIVPGFFLHQIYYEHGSRLLEGNVRAFLSTRGKINKGIRNTIRNEPTKFFTYNNGIACTAQSVQLSEDGRNIIMMEDLQIINGGQTTASLTSAVLKDHMRLDNIFVPMKLTVVKEEDSYEDMISKISKYANSQNKVSDADLFSNHPFHRKFEELSQKIQAPAPAGGINNTFWYYERSRGKYEQEQFKLLKKNEKEAFLRKYPKKQVIKKEQLAKYYTCTELLRPDWVSLGSQNCMKKFAEYIDKEFEKSPEFINEVFFKQCICYAILFLTTDVIVKKAPWYNKGGYKLNIVPYTISKLIDSIPQGYSLDYELIWKKQELYPSLIHEIEMIAPITDEFIKKSNGIIVTEFCKKKTTWDKYKEKNYSISHDFANDLVNRELIDEQIRSAKKDSKETEKVNTEIEIYNKGGPYWRKLIEEGKKRGILYQNEVEILSIPASIDTEKPKFLKPKQVKLVCKIREKLENAGVLV